MSDAPSPSAQSTPVHLWIVGIVSLLWNLVGAFDYVATKLQLDFVMSRYTEEQLAYYYGFPAWATVFWALAVWCGVAGSILLLVRKRVAFQLFLISLVSMVINSVYAFGMSNGMEIQGTGGFIFTLVIFAIALGLVLYSRAMRARGVLA